MSELLDLSACSLAERFKNRSVTPADYADALLDHIARWEPHLNALCRFDPAQVREQALASTRRWAAGVPLSEIDGVPVTIKELIATQGDRVAQGSAAAADAPPAVAVV